MKLSLKQLHRLIKEAMEATPERASKRAAWDGPFANNNPQDSAYEFAEQWAATWPFDDGDPSMNASGPDIWNAQVQKAKDELGGSLEELLNDIESKLINGEYDPDAGGSPR